MVLSRAGDVRGTKRPPDLGRRPGPTPHHVDQFREDRTRLSEVSDAPLRVPRPAPPIRSATPPIRSAEIRDTAVSRSQTQLRADVDRPLVDDRLFLSTPLSQ